MEECQLKIGITELEKSPFVIDLGKDHRWRLKLLGKILLGHRIFPVSEHHSIDESYIT